MKRLFGTDGIRGVAGESPLDAAGVRRFGAALAAVVGRRNDRTPRVALGRDTRESGGWLAHAVAAGLSAHGVDSVDAGVITTPGLAHALQRLGFDAGVMISASHNPFRDNGLKVFGRDGMKLSDELEQNIEVRILDDGIDDPGVGRAANHDASLRRCYLAHLESLLEPGRFAGVKVALDCANGAAATLAPEVFRNYGAEVLAIGTQPDGRNINLDCGSLHLESLAEYVRTHDCDLGLAFDGDADRCLAVDRKGRQVDGDAILFVTGRHLKRRGELQGDALVATVMSNFWLEQALTREGISLHRTKVGDKYVLERMVAENLTLGGEQSGHVIFRKHATTGDGMLTGLLLLDALGDGDASLETIVDGIEPYPQLLINVRVREKPDLREHATIGPVVSEVESELEGKGRVVLRYSGTEPLARVMIEGRDDALVRRLSERLAGAIRRELGA